jgi:hypothetical protein
MQKWRRVEARGEKRFMDRCMLPKKEGSAIGGKNRRTPICMINTGGIVPDNTDWNVFNRP